MQIYYIDGLFSIDATKILFRITCLYFLHSLWNSSPVFDNFEFIGIYIST